MGPIIIFDKSTIQSLSDEEARWLTHHYFSNITPILFFEILADLKKEFRDKRSPETFVAGLADKFSPINSVVNTHHIYLFMNELIAGIPVEMDKRAVIGGGKIITDATGKKGVFLDEPPEQEAFRRWQKGEFAELEHLVAKRWRTAIQEIDSEAFVKHWHGLMQGAQIPNLEYATRLVDSFCSGNKTRFTLLKALMLSLGVPPAFKPAIIKRWKALGGPPIMEFAPYAAWCFRVNLLSNIAIAHNLVRKPLDANNRIDLQYLYYLPFCQVFVSNDIFHKTIAPLLLKSDQSFIAGLDLKCDLAKIDAHWKSLSEEEKSKGSINYAAYPPLNPELLTCQLWDKHMTSGWQEHAKNPIVVTKELSEQIMKQLKPMLDAIEKQTHLRPNGTE